MKLRNKTDNSQYGAAEIKSIYRKNLTKGLIYALIIHCVIIGMYLLASYMNRLKADDDINKGPKIFNFDDLYDNNDNDKTDKKIDVPNQNIIQAIKDLAALTPVWVPKDQADKITLKTQNELDTTGNNVAREGDTTGIVPYSDDYAKVDDNTIDRNINKIEDKIKKDPDVIIFQPTEVDVIPVCVNFAQVNNMMKYPEIALEAQVQGNVTVKVLVNQEGYVEKTGKLTGPGVFYNEVKEKAMLLQFKPGLNNGKTVKVWVTVPFKFELK
jgi:TonB family protein